jgi:hypothetical protein
MKEWLKHLIGSGHRLTRKEIEELPVGTVLKIHPMHSSWDKKNPYKVRLTRVDEYGFNTEMAEDNGYPNPFFGRFDFNRFEWEHYHNGRFELHETNL